MRCKLWCNQTTIAPLSPRIRLAITKCSYHICFKKFEFRKPFLKVYGTTYLLNSGFPPTLETSITESWTKGDPVGFEAKVNTPAWSFCFRESSGLLLTVILGEPGDVPFDFEGLADEGCWSWLFAKAVGEGLPGMNMARSVIKL